MVDCRNRNIDNRILEVCTAEPGEKPWDARRNRFIVILANEFFRDRCTPEYTVPAMFAAQTNSNYFGWQKVDLAQLDKEKYRPKNQKTDIDGPSADGVDRYAISEAGYYDRAMKNTIWFRFLQNETDFINRSKTLHYDQSPGVKRLILQNMGFEYCCKRYYLQTTHRDMLGYTANNFACEVWAHPKGIIAHFSVSDNMPLLYECQITCKFDGTYGDMHFHRLEPRGGSMGYASGKHPGTITKYQSAPYNLRKMIDNPLLLPEWGEGMAGFKHLSLWSYLEENFFDGTIEDFFKYHAEDVCSICKDVPLLRKICCD